jgi:thiol-disulfide isomerase/thioredoxin
MDKIINLKNYQKTQKPQKPFKMLFLTILIGASVGFILWNYFVENIAALDVQIPTSKNITFSDEMPISMTTQQVADEFEGAEGGPILIYIYTTWCPSCKKGMPIINEIAREFQNTDLRVLSLAIDREMDSVTLRNHLKSYGDIYFQPRFLSFKEGFIELLRKKNIKYSNRIPLTVLIARDGSVVTKFTGNKSRNYIRNKIIRQFN